MANEHIVLYEASGIQLSAPVVHPSFSSMLLGMLGWPGTLLWCDVI